MEWFLGILAVGVIAIAAIASTGRLGQFGRNTDAERAPLNLPPEGPLTREDIDQVKFAIVVRGYAMDQVDAVLDRLAAQVSPDPASLGGPETGIMGEGSSHYLDEIRSRDGSDEASNR
jgi:DivIVA domain-containing protein